MNKINLGKFSIIFRMLLLLGLFTYVCGSFSYAETLPQLNQSTDPIRYYLFEHGEKATLEENMGVTSPGIFAIVGQDKDSNSILFNSYSGFVIRESNITLDISNVTLSGASSKIGAAIYSTMPDANIVLSNLKFVGNSVVTPNNALGGAIYTNSALTITNTSFIGNYAVTSGDDTRAEGGAIYSLKDVSIIADSDNVEIVDNYTEDSNGRTNNAIYMADASTLTLKTQNKGEIQLKDDVSGNNGYKVNITSDGTGKVGLYGSIENADTIKASDVKITTVNGEIENRNLDNLDVGNNVSLSVDVDLENGAADTITSANGKGTLNLSEISVIAGSEDEKTIQVIKTTGNLQLNIDQLQSKQVTELQATMYSSSILADTLSLATTDTTNDSFVISGWKDVLYEMVKDAEPTHMIKNFIFDTESEYVLSKDLSNMAQESILTIYNISDAERGTINANGHSLFKMDNPISSVTLRDIEIKNARSDTNGAVANLSNNTASFTTYNSKITNNSSDGKGGAFYIRNGSLSLNNTEVSNNTATGDGGALYITNEANVEIVNTDFINNTSDGKGGAIFTDKNLKITAENGSSTFRGNTASGESNAIYVNTPDTTVTLNAGKKGTINMNDKITGTEEGYNVNMTGETSGKINLNDSITNADIDMKKVTLKMGKDDLLQGNDLNIHSGTLNLQNGEAGNMDLNKFTLSGNMSMKVDADLQNETMDRINAEEYGSAKGMITVNSVNITSDSKSRFSYAYFADPKLRQHVKTTVTKAYSPVYRYFVRYDKSNGYFIFNRGPEDISWWFNPAVLAGAIAQQTAYMNQLNNYNAALYHSDVYMTLPREVREHTGNLYDEPYDTMTYYQIQEQLKTIWVRPYTSVESITLHRGPKIHSLNYGTLIGGDSDMIDIGHGFKYVYSGYVGYNGNNYRYEDVRATQQGGLIGATAYLYKGNFFNALTANVGWMFNDSATIYGTDVMNVLMTGFSDRAGYNFELKNGKVIIQPTLTMGYSIVFSTSYTSRNEVKIKSDPLHAVHFIPGLRIIGNLSNGWQPYATVNLICSFVDQTNMMANHVRIPRMSVDPYVEYGIGVQKRWGDKYSGFAQASLRGGGRKGGSFLMGFRCMLGQIINLPNKLPHADARPRKVFFKERKRADITVEPIKRRFKPEKRKVEREEKPGFRLNVFDAFKKMKKKMTYTYNTDVSAKVVTDTFDDGVIMPSIKGMKSPKKGEMNDYRDEDRLNPLSREDRGTITREVEQKVKVKGVNKVNTQPSAQNLKPIDGVNRAGVNVKANPAAQGAGVNVKANPTVQGAGVNAKVNPATQGASKGANTQATPAAQGASKGANTQATPAAKSKTEYIQRRPKTTNKTLNLNQTKYEEITKPTYMDYELEIIELKF